MPTYTITGPDGKDYSIDGPVGATKEQVTAEIQKRMGGQQQEQSTARGATPGLLRSAASGLIEGAGAPGDLSQKVLGGAPPQQPIDHNTYYGKLIDALNHARSALELPTTQRVGNMVGMQPTQPVTGAESAIQRAASMVPGAAMGGSPVGRAMMGTAPAASAVRGMGMAPQGPASSLARDPGGMAQQGLLRSVAKEALTAGGHAVGGPLGGIAARFAPKMLGME